MTETKPKRRWFRYSLRALLVLVTVLCVWLAMQVNAARRQKNAVDALRKAGGEVLFDYQRLPSPGDWQGLPLLKFDRNALPPGPNWLRKIIGEDYFRTAVWVQVLGKTLTASDLASLAELKQLTALTAAASHIDDAGMAQIGKLTKLEILLVPDNQITDTGLEHIQNLANLERLDLHDTNVSDRGLRFLTRFNRLKLLWLQGSQVTSEGFRELKKSLPNTTIDGAP